MKTSKLVVGIISIVLCFLVGLQSCAAGLGNALENNGEIGGTAGLILAISLLIAGIVAICTRNGGKGGYVSTAFYVLAGLIGLLCAGMAGIFLVLGVLVLGVYLLNKVFQEKDKQ